MTEEQILIDLLKGIVSAGHIQLSTIKPSQWAEENIVMGKPYPGPLRYDKTPYTREIIDLSAPDHPARVIAVKKAAQIGFSATVIYAFICWMIKNNPGNTYLTVGAPDLIEKAMEKLDLFIDNCNLRQYIKPQVMRKRAQKSGDTNYKKEFSGGYVTVASAGNHKAIRQVDLQNGLIDDFESVKMSSKESGSTRKLLEQRFASYADTMKLYLISTPELMEMSNIQESYLLGDQRKFHIPCPCCGEMITLEWTIEVDINGEKVVAGMTWKTDANGRLIPDSVKYRCQACGDYFDDRNKYELLNAGRWVPTAEPSREGFYSYHINALYAYAGMFDWKHYVQDYIEANPPGQPPNEALMKAFTNLVLGEPYESASESPKANQIMKNLRAYAIGSIPERTSISDGNGRIVLVTCSVDLNGTVDDARIDYEVVGWSETGCAYSIDQGSIGTFIPREGTKKVKEDRRKFTYEENKENSVWPELLAVMSKRFVTDSRREVAIGMNIIDTGHFTTHAYNFMNKVNRLVNIRGIKGDKEEQYIRFDHPGNRFRVSQERQDLYILKVGLIKDTLSDYMSLRWNENAGEKQPGGFMNYPQQADGKYSFKDFFEHYESEHRLIVVNKDGSTASRWMKKSSISQNHFFDVRVYNIAAKEIYTHEIGKRLGIKPFTWNDFSTIAAKGIEDWEKRQSAKK